jgi:hypothetical protein
LLEDAGSEALQIDSDVRILRHGLDGDRSQGGRCSAFFAVRLEPVTLRVSGADAGCGRHSRYKEALDVGVIEPGARPP